MARDGVAGKLCLDRIPDVTVDDRLVLAGIALALVGDLADIDRVVQQLVDMAGTERCAAGAAAIVGFARLGAEPEAVRFLLHRPMVPSRR